jgi:hypothetical protein
VRDAGRQELRGPYGDYRGADDDRRDQRRVVVRDEHPLCGCNHRRQRDRECDCRAETELAPQPAEVAAPSSRQVRDHQPTSATDRDEDSDLARGVRAVRHPCDHGRQ